MQKSFSGCLISTTGVPVYFLAGWRPGEKSVGGSGVWTDSLHHQWKKDESRVRIRRTMRVGLQSVWSDWVASASVCVSRLYNTLLSVSMCLCIKPLLCARVFVSKRWGYLYAFMYVCMWKRDSLFNSCPSHFSGFPDPVHWKEERKVIRCVQVFPWIPTTEFCLCIHREGKLDSSHYDVDSSEWKPIQRSTLRTDTHLLKHVVQHIP
jgi:hypothetical protein